MSLKALQKTITKAQTNRDDFAVGTVLRWTYLGRYTYAALKTGAGWYTTSQQGSNRTTWERLLEDLTKPEVTNVAVSTEWTPIGEQVEDDDPAVSMPAEGEVLIGPGRLVSGSVSFAGEMPSHTHSSLR